MYSFQFDSDGNLKVTGGGGGGSDVTIVGQTVTVLTEDAADGIIGSPVGTDAIQIGYKDGSGNVQIPSSANPLPVAIALANTAPATQNITVVDSASTSTGVANGGTFITGVPTTGSAASFALTSPASTVTFQVTGTWTGTLAIEASIDGGTTWVSAGVHQQGTQYFASSFTANFIGEHNAAGYTNVRVRATAAVTGTAVVKIVETLSDRVMYLANGVTIRDATTQSITSAVKAASTAAATTDPSLVVALSPNTPGLQRKVTTLLNPATIAGSATYNSAWIDTQATGCNYVSCVFLIPSSGYASNALKIQTSDDQTNIITAAQTTPTVATLGSFFAAINQRYYRIQFVNGSTLQTSPTLTVDEFDIPAVFSITGAAGLLAAQTTTGILDAAIGNGNTLADATTGTGIGGFTTGTFAMGVVNMQVTSGSGAATVMQRTPATFLSCFCSTGITVILAPNTAKKMRLMRYKIEIGGDVSISGGPTPLMMDWVYGSSVNFGTNQQLGIGVGNNPYGISTFGITHRAEIAASAAASNIPWDSDWIDLGNGQIPQFTNQPWGIALSVAQPITTGYNPTWTIASNQWECITMGFQSIGAAGGARVRAITQAVGTSSATTVGISPKTGNALIVVVRTTNIAAGAPTVTITDASGNSTVYTSLAQVTNASDGANGSSLQVFYTLGIKGTWNGSALTATTSVHAATATELLVAEVAGITAVGGTGQASATGNSTSPASGNYAPAEAGDYIVNFFGSAANIAAATVTPGLLRSYQNSASGTVGMADNFANATLTTGAINVLAVGTEE